MKSNRKKKRQNDNLNDQLGADKDKYKLLKNGFEIKIEPLQISSELDDKLEDAGLEIKTELEGQNSKTKQFERDRLAEVEADTNKRDQDELSKSVEESEFEVEEINEELDKLSEVDIKQELDAINSEKAMEEVIGEVVERINPSRVELDENKPTKDNVNEADYSQVKQTEEDYADNEELSLNQGQDRSETKKGDEREVDTGDTFFEEYKTSLDEEEPENKAELLLEEDLKINIKASTRSALIKLKTGTGVFLKKIKTNWQKRKKEKVEFHASLNALEKEKLQKRNAAGTLILSSTIVAIIINIAWAKIPVEAFNLSRYNLDGVFFKNLLTFLFAMLIPSFIVFRLFSLKQEEVLGNTKQSSTSYILTALMGLPLAVAITGLHNLTIFALDKIGISVTFKNYFAINQSPSSIGFVLMLMVLVLIPAVVEEFMFRGVLQTCFRRADRLHLSILLTATVASLFFKNIMFILVYLLVAVVLSYVKEKADDLFVPIVLHISMSTTLLVMQYFLPLYSSSIELKSIDGRSTFYVILILALVAIVLLIPLFKASFSAYADSRVDDDESNLKFENSIEFQDDFSPVDWKFMLAILVLIVSSVMI